MFESSIGQVYGAVVIELHRSLVQHHTVTTSELFGVTSRGRRVLCTFFPFRAICLVAIEHLLIECCDISIRVDFLDLLIFIFTVKTRVFALIIVRSACPSDWAFIF